MAKVTKKVVKAESSNVLKVSFTLKNETKGALRYSEVDATGKVKEYANAVMGTIYLRKNALDGKKPDHLTIRVNLD